MINYRGKEYPTRTFELEYLPEHGKGKVTYVVASMSLQDAFNDMTIPADGVDPTPDDWDDDAQRIDEDIYFYVDSDEELAKIKPGEIVELDIPFMVLEEI